MRTGYCCPEVLSAMLMLQFAIAAGAQAPQVQNPEAEIITFKAGLETFKTELVKIPAGKFMMGSSKEELALLKEKFDYTPDDEKKHEVELSAFSMAKYQVTKGQFRLFVLETEYQTEAEREDGAWGWNRAKKEWEKCKDYHWKNPGFPQGDDHPVICVSWNDAQAYCAWLTKRSGKKVRLPSEAQWEYACRAGSKTLYFFSDDEEDLMKHANVADASFRKETGYAYGIRGDDGYAFTAPVGKFKGNKWGLYDMHGNVFQWCEDYYRRDYEQIVGKNPLNRLLDERHVLRGGSWVSNFPTCRAADRNVSKHYHRNTANGFRVVVLP